MIPKIQQSHSHADRDADLYQTPIEATLALMRIEKLPAHILEPAVGMGAISSVLINEGHNVVGGDIVDRRAETPFQDYVQDFLALEKAPDGTGMILTNPPYLLAGEFAAHALKLCPLVVLLLRLNFMESVRRTEILEGGQLKHVHVFRNRRPAMHRFGWDGPKVTTAIPYAWFVWDANHRGPTTIDRISWTPISNAVAAE